METPTKVPEASSEKIKILCFFVGSQAVVAGITLYCLTFLLAPWMEEFSLSRSSALSIVMLHLFAIGGWAVLLGRLFESTPSRVLVSIGLGLFALGLILLSVSPNIFVVILIYVLVLPVPIHLAGSMAAVTIIGRNFGKRRGMALGIASTGTSLGGAVFPFVVTAMLDSHGWRDTLAVIGATAGVIMAPLGYYILRNENKSPSRLDGPAVANTSNKMLNFLTQRNFWLFSLSFLLAYTSFSGLQNNIGPFSSDIGLSSNQSASVMSSFALAMVAGKLTTGALADRIDNRVLFCTGSGLVAASAIVLTSFQTYSGALTAFIVCGFGSGAYLPLNGSIIAQTFGPHNMGRVIGISAPIITFCALGPPLAGAARDLTGNYDAAFLGASFFSILTIPLILSIYNSLRR